jgi:hypothetical protein
MEPSSEVWFPLEFSGADEATFAGRARDWDVEPSAIGRLGGLGPLGAFRRDFLWVCYMT